PANSAPLPAVRPVEPLGGKMDLPDAPNAFGDTQAAIIRFDIKIDNKPPAGLKPGQRSGMRAWHEAYWERFDLRTGKPVGPALKLWKSLEDQNKPEGYHGWVLPPTPVAGLTADGEQMALADVAN